MHSYYVLIKINLIFISLASLTHLWNCYNRSNIDTRFILQPNSYNSIVHGKLEDGLKEISESRVRVEQKKSAGSG